MTAIVFGTQTPHWLIHPEGLRKIEMLGAVRNKRTMKCAVSRELTKYW